MRITIKTLEGKQFPVELEPSQLVSAVKAAIAQAQPPLEATRQKLVFQGKILEDERTVESYGVKDGGFIVCMMQKPKVQAAQPPDGHGAEEQDELGVGEDEEQGGPTVTTLAPPQMPQPGPPPVDEAVVRQVQEITGFQADQVRAALQITYGDADGAIDFLMSGGGEFEGGGEEEGGGEMVEMMHDQAAGSVLAMDLIPPELQDQAAALQGQAAPQPQPSVLDHLRDHPQFVQLRALVQSNPALLESVMTQIGQQNPEVLQAIQENPEEFLALLNEPVQQGDGIAAASTPTPAPVPASTAPTVELSPAEAESVGRLEALGFGRQAAIEAFMACDKNEELAANLLFDQMS